MKINEIILENKSAYQGWDDERSESFRVNGTKDGVITIARSFDENDEVDRIMYNYYDKNIIGNTNIPVVGVRMEKNGIVRQFVYGEDGINGTTRDIGTIDGIPNLYKYFMELVIGIINKNIYLGENMNGKLTLEQFMNMNSEIVNAMKTAENEFRSEYSKRTMAESQSVNMSPYKDAIKNAETPKKKSAKSKVEQLFNK
jgi:hypothetical protein